MNDARSARQPENAPDPAFVRAAVERVVASRVFRDSPQLIAFLRYIVEETLAGRAEGIKGYSIATEALGRSDDFDPQSDPIVRVQATRLRRALATYYGEEGEADDLIVRLDPGGYVPRFEPRGAGREAIVPPLEVEEGEALGLRSAGAMGARAPATAPPGPAWGARAVAALALILVLGAAGYLAATRFGGAPSARTERLTPVVLVEPPELPDAAAALRPWQSMMLHDLRDALARFDDMLVIAEAAASPGGAPPAAKYRLQSRFSEQGESRARVAFSLVHEPDGRVVWARSFDFVPTTAPEIGLRLGVIRSVATTLGQPYGVLLAEQHRLAGAEDDASGYRCLIDTFRYWADMSIDRLEATLGCVDRALLRSPEASSLHAAQAFLLVERYRLDAAGNPAFLEQALAAANRAVGLAPASARSHQALMAALFLRRDFAGAMAAGSKALELNPFDTDIIADVGARQMQMGSFDSGRALLRRASVYALSVPDWHRFFQFLDALHRDDAAGMAQASGGIVSDTYPLGLLARVVTAWRQGDEAAARGFLARLVALNPELGRDPRAFLRRAVFTKPIIDRLVAPLEALGG
jgi:hypothetical protein